MGENAQADGRPIRAGAEADMLSAVLLAQRAAAPDQALFRALDKALAQTPGHLLLTVLVYHEDEGESHRAYSSRPSEYPTGGRKSLEQAPRMRQVLASGEPYLGRTRQDIIDNFRDHGVLLAMGCGSVVNMPVCWGSQVLGTVNLLHGEGHYALSDFLRISTWAQLAVPAFLVSAQRR